MQQLYIDCITVDWAGSTPKFLKTTLDILGKSFRKAKAILEECGLFKFKKIFEALSSGQGKLIGYMVTNLHGYYNKAYWELDFIDGSNSQSDGSNSQSDGNQDRHLRQIEPPLMATTTATDGSNSQSDGSISRTLPQKKHTQQDFQKSQQCLNNSSTSPQLPTKVVEEEVDKEKQEPEQEKEREPIAPGAALSQEEEPEMENMEPENVETENQEPENIEKELSAKERPILRPNPTPQECQSTPNTEHPTPLALTRAQIMEILDNATQGIAPHPEAIAALLNTQYDVAIINAIRINPQWGINLSDYHTQNHKNSPSREERQHRKSRLNAMALLPEAPSVEFLKECCTDPLLRQLVKKLILAKPSWNLRWDYFSAGAGAIAVSCEV